VVTTPREQLSIEGLATYTLAGAGTALVGAFGYIAFGLRMAAFSELGDIAFFADIGYISKHCLQKR